MWADPVLLNGGISNNDEGGTTWIRQRQPPLPFSKGMLVAHSRWKEGLGREKREGDPGRGRPIWCVIENGPRQMLGPISPSSTQLTTTELGILNPNSGDEEDEHHDSDSGDEDEDDGHYDDDRDDRDD